MAILGKQDQMAISQFLREHLLGRVGIEVWSRKDSGLVLTDRDPCTHCDDTVSVMRELVSLHAGFTFTPYDLDRHSERASPKPTNGRNRAVAFFQTNGPPK